MAHKNLNERRAYVRSMLDQGFTLDAQDRKFIADKFGCTIGAINMDIGVLSDPIDWLGLRAPSQAAVQRNRCRKLGITDHFSSAEWRKLIRQHNGECAFCHSKVPLGPDHIIPVSRGGTNTIDNVQPLCFPCNAHKHTKILM